MGLLSEISLFGGRSGVMEVVVYRDEEKVRK
jgi:hypothetical protein